MMPPVDEYPYNSSSNVDPGSTRWMTTVLSSAVAISSILLNDTCVDAGPLTCLIVSYVHLTSAEVNGTLSCHLTLLARWNVYVLLSGLISHDFASAGLMLPSMPM